MKETREIEGFDMTLMLKYDLMIPWVYPLTCSKDEWNFTLSLLEKYKIDPKLFRTLLYLVRSYQKEIVEELPHELMLEEWDKPEHNAIVSLRNQINKLEVGKWPHELERAIKDISLSIKGRQVSVNIPVVKRAIADVLFKEILKYEGKTKTKPAQSATSAIRTMAKFAKMTTTEDLLKKGNVIDFVQEILEFYGVSFEKYKDPQALIQKYLRLKAD